LLKGVEQSFREVEELEARRSFPEHNMVEKSVTLVLEKKHNWHLRSRACTEAKSHTTGKKNNP